MENAKGVWASRNDLLLDLLEGYVMDDNIKDIWESCNESQKMLMTITLNWALMDVKAALDILVNLKESDELNPKAYECIDILKGVVDLC